MWGWRSWLMEWGVGAQGVSGPATLLCSVFLCCVLYSYVAFFFRMLCSVFLYCVLYSVFLCCALCTQISSLCGTVGAIVSNHGVWMGSVDVCGWGVQNWESAEREVAMSKQSNWIGWEPTNIPIDQEHPFILASLKHGPRGALVYQFYNQIMLRYAFLLQVAGHKVRKFLDVAMNSVWNLTIALHANKSDVACCTLLGSLQWIMHCALFAFMLQANEIVSCWPSSALAVTSRENLKTGSNPRQHPSKDANWLQSRNPGNIRPKISNWMKTGSHSNIWRSGVQGFCLICLWLKLNEQACKPR